ncbi:STN and carboxypeptidase regulatory-like domain-containing protein [Spirosoma flavus]
MRSLIGLLFVLLSLSLQAQSVPPLDRIISVDIRNEKMESALRQISQAGRFEFSYNPARINGATLVTLRLVNTPVREVLNRLFQRQIMVKSRGNHIILVRGDVTDETPKNFLVDGYILDEKTGQRIAQASIFEKTTLASTVSNPFGYYRLRLPTGPPSLRLDVRKQDYLGETVIIRSRTPHSVSIRMRPQPISLSVVEPLPVRITEDSTQATESSLSTVPVETPLPMVDTTVKPAKSVVDQGMAGVTKLLVSAQQAIHDINLNRDTLYRNWQVSFLPTIGTNLRLSGRISNKFSVNALAGYSFGVRAFELGGLVNIVRTNVQGFQAAGLANVVGGKVTGVQFGGLVNHTNQSVRGVQAAGLINTVIDSVKGLQMAGLINFARSDVQGAQVAGLLNISTKSVRGVQVAGLINYAHQDVAGWQIAGILNRARTVTKGSQIGLINVADSLGGVPIGLISYVRKGGFLRIEAGTDELNLLNVTLRTGVRRLYNILTAGYSFEREGSPRMTAGYGLGTAFGLSPRTLLSLEGTYHHHFYFDRPTEEWNNQLRFSTLVETKLTSHVALAFGPSVNWYFTQDEYLSPFLKPSIPIVSERSDVNGNRYWGWIGFQVGIRYGK